MSRWIPQRVGQRRTHGVFDLDQDSTILVPRAQDSHLGRPVAVHIVKLLDVRGRVIGRKPDQGVASDWEKATEEQKRINIMGF